MLNNKDLKLVIQGMTETAIENNLNEDMRKGIFIVASGLNETLKQRFKTFKGYTMQEIAHKCMITIKA